MRKKFFSGVFALALLATAGWGVNKSMSNDSNLTGLALANLEALAYIEWGPDPEIGTYCDLDCYDGGQCWRIIWTWNLPCERTGNPYDFCRC